jgi:hypothetical protein
MSSVNAIGFAATIAVGLPAVPCVADWQENGMGSMRYPTEAANDRTFRSAADAPDPADQSDDSERE